MSIGNKTLKVVLAAEIGAACLLVAGIVWGFTAPAAADKAGGNLIAGQSNPTTQPAAIQLSATPLPTATTSGLVVIWPTGQKFAARETGQPQPAYPIVTADPIPRSEKLLPSGQLAYEEQYRLYKASQAYIAASAQEAIDLAHKLNFIGKDSDPSNMCGPLSIAILRDAGLVSAEADINQFWLLDPREPLAKRLLLQTFPAERFEHLTSPAALNEVDWNLSPLYPGDFMYIYAGPAGSFEHMLVVNHVDAQKRAFAVTNHKSADGRFVVDEILLYDPNDKNTGIFAYWTSEPYARQGTTGFGGFEIWRPRAH